MTLAEKIKLIDDMIEENPEVTIRDYIELVKEIKGIQSRSIFLNRQSRERYYEVRNEFIRT